MFMTGMPECDLYRKDMFYKECVDWLNHKSGQAIASAKQLRTHYLIGDHVCMSVFLNSVGFTLYQTRFDAFSIRVSPKTHKGLIRHPHFKSNKSKILNTGLAHLLGRYHLSMELPYTINDRALHLTRIPKDIATKTPKEVHATLATILCNMYALAFLIPTKAIDLNDPFLKYKFKEISAEYSVCLNLIKSFL